MSDEILLDDIEFGEDYVMYDVYENNENEQFLYKYISDLLYTTYHDKNDVFVNKKIEDYIQMFQKKETEKKINCHIKPVIDVLKTYFAYPNEDKPVPTRFENFLEIKNEMLQRKNTVDYSSAYVQELEENYHTLDEIQECLLNQNKQTMRILKGDNVNIIGYTNAIQNTREFKSYPPWNFKSSYFYKFENVILTDINKNNFEQLKNDFLLYDPSIHIKSGCIPNTISSLDDLYEICQTNPLESKESFLVSKQFIESNLSSRKKQNLEGIFKNKHVQQKIYDSFNEKDVSVYQLAKLIKNHKTMYRNEIALIYSQNKINGFNPLFFYDECFRPRDKNNYVFILNPYLSNEMVFHTEYVKADDIEGYNPTYFFEKENVNETIIQKDKTLSTNFNDTFFQLLKFENYKREREIKQYINRITISLTHKDIDLETEKEEVPYDYELLKLDNMEDIFETTKDRIKYDPFDKKKKFIDFLKTICEMLSIIYIRKNETSYFNQDYSYFNQEYLDLCLTIFKKLSRFIGSPDSDDANFIMFYISISLIINYEKIHNKRIINNPSAWISEKLNWESLIFKYKEFSIFLTNQDEFAKNINIFYEKIIKYEELISYNNSILNIQDFEFKFRIYPSYAFEKNNILQSQSLFIRPKIFIEKKTKLIKNINTLKIENENLKNEKECVKPFEQLSSKDITLIEEKIIKEKLQEYLLPDANINFDLFIKLAKFLQSGLPTLLGRISNSFLKKKIQNQRYKNIDHIILSKLPKSNFQWKHDSMFQDITNLYMRKFEPMVYYKLLNLFFKIYDDMKIEVRKVIKKEMTNFYEMNNDNFKGYIKGRYELLRENRKQEKIEKITNDKTFKDLKERNLI